MQQEKDVDALVAPSGALELLSHQEIDRLADTSTSGLYELFRCCALAVLNTGAHSDDSKAVLERYKNFSVKIVQQDWGIKLEIKQAPLNAFVDGEMITGIQEHLFAVLRDIVFSNNEVERLKKHPKNQENITNLIFHILRNAKILKAAEKPDLVVCWGGHSINRTEYKYTKDVGYELGLRRLNVCTGCGPGAMKGPMKGATIAHAKQRMYTGHYVGITEPGIIAAESPNAIVNRLVIMPDIEKRLEAFVRSANGIIVFPGGAGTAEEILYLLGVLLHPNNKGMPFPLIFTGPKESELYFKQIHHFVGETLGYEAQQLYKIIIGDPVAVAQSMYKGIQAVYQYRKENGDAYYYNWLLHIEQNFQEPFEPNHENMSQLALTKAQAKHDLAANLRRAFSGIVAGNVKDEGIRTIEAHGPFTIHGDPKILAPLDQLLANFVQHHRMKLPNDEDYQPCYRVIS